MISVLIANASNKRRAHINGRADVSSEAKSLFNLIPIYMDIYTLFINISAMLKKKFGQANDISVYIAICTQASLNIHVDVSNRLQSSLSLCTRAAKALASLRICAGSSENSLLASAILINISCTCTCSYYVIDINASFNVFFFF